MRMEQELPPELSSSPLYSADLAPIPANKRTWNVWNLSALWVGMAVCIPTYLLASYMMRAGLSWLSALMIIGLANLVITVPMVLNGHAGVKYGIPFPVVGRAAFGTQGIHIPSLVRAIVACGWFGVQTWIGGLALYSIWNAATGAEGVPGLDLGKFIGFGSFWLIQIWFIWRGTESIKWMETWSAPVLIVIGLLLIGWGARNAGGFANALEQGKQLQHGTVTIAKATDEQGRALMLAPLHNTDGTLKATHYRLMPVTTTDLVATPWTPLVGRNTEVPIGMQTTADVQFKDDAGNLSSIVNVNAEAPPDEGVGFWSYLLWFTAMVGFWATMAISISDITRFAKTQKDQIAGQFIGLPGTMLFYSFVAIFVTSAAVVAFKDVLIAEDAPWDPVTLISKFHEPGVVIFAQFAMLIATLSTNIAANVIAPANAISNLFPKKISFRAGGLIAGLIGVAICPWWLMDEISGILVFVSGLLGPVLGILLCDYFLVRKRTLVLADLYRENGPHAGVSKPALIALIAGVLVALVGYWVKPLEALYQLSWFSGFAVAFVVYLIGMQGRFDRTCS